MYWGSGTELDVRTEVVPPTLAEVAHATWYPRLNSHTVSCKQWEAREGGAGRGVVARNGSEGIHHLAIWASTPVNCAS